MGKRKKRILPINFETLLFPAIGKAKLLFMGPSVDSHTSHSHRAIIQGVAQPESWYCQIHKMKTFKDTSLGLLRIVTLMQISYLT